MKNPIEINRGVELMDDEAFEPKDDKLKQKAEYITNSAVDNPNLSRLTVSNVSIDLLRPPPKTPLPLI